MNKEHFKLGDVVELKSGSPRMTVNEVNEDRISCCWFNNGNVMWSNFPHQCLRHCDR